MPFKVINSREPSGDFSVFGCDGLYFLGDVSDLLVDDDQFGLPVDFHVNKMDDDGAPTYSNYYHFLNLRCALTSGCGFVLFGTGGRPKFTTP